MITEKTTYVYKMQWNPISEAKKTPGLEILGVDIRGGKIFREPYLTFWSPTLQKFYCSPTHWVPFPDMPADD